MLAVAPQLLAQRQVALQRAALRQAALKCKAPQRVKLRRVVVQWVMLRRVALRCLCPLSSSASLWCGVFVALQCRVVVVSFCRCVWRCGVVVLCVVVWVPVFVRRCGSASVSVCARVLVCACPCP